MSERDGQDESTPKRTKTPLVTRTPFKRNPKTSKDKEGSDIVSVSELLPPNLPLLPTAPTNLFPGMILPLVLPEGKLIKVVDHVLEGAGYLGLVFPEGEHQPLATGPTTLGNGPGPEMKSSGGFHRYGVAVKVMKKINLPDNKASVLVTGLERFELKNVVAKEPHLVGAVKYIYEKTEKSVEIEAMLRSAIQQFKVISKDNPLITEEMKVALVNITGPGRLADFMASVLSRDLQDYLDFLSIEDVGGRLERLLLLLRKEMDLQSVQRKIQDEINQKITSQQKEFYLQEQLKFIEKELGRSTDDRARVLDKYRTRLDAVNPPQEVRARIEEELEKLGSLHEQSSEYSVSLNYVDWATSLPWGVRSQESHALLEAKKVLDHDHFGLNDVKERILEFLAVKKLKKNAEGSILCFVGPPGTGKTSLGKSIARALHRKFFRFSVGGMRDEAEIKGHRRTYVGAMPGKMIQGMKRVGVKNPVFLIDEVDKLGNGFHTGGDPSSALLELLDPEQNTEFLDHYLDIPFDCSEVFFILTANTVDSIPPALLDRMEVIPLRGYSDNEKLEIAKRYLLPKQLKKNALKRGQLRLSDESLRHIITHYAREAGVRNLEKQLARICRKIAYKVAMGRVEKLVIDDKKQIGKLLGIPPFSPERELTKELPGVATGLAWTSFGGEVLFIESSVVDGKGGLSLTGSLGDVMKESGHIATMVLRNRGKKLGLSPDYFERHHLHLHVPAGATPKDGPSAGLTMLVSLYSLLLGRPVRKDVAMTGEITLTGQVLPVGGIKEKLLAAKRAGVHTVVLPRLNARDLKEVEAEVRSGVKVVMVKNVDEALRYLLPKH